MDNSHNVARRRRKFVVIFITIFIFVCLLLPGISPSISALGPGEEASDAQSVEDTPGSSKEPAEIPQIEDYLDETWLRHCVKSLLVERAKNHPDIKLPEPTAKAVFSAQVSGKVALSFDDGPYEGLTEEYLEVLKKHGVGATFFLVGNRVEKFPELAKKIAEAEFDVGSHSFAHSQLTKRNAAWVTKDFEKTIAAIKKTTDVEVKLFRPPYGDYNTTVLKAAADQGLITVRWNVDPRDWQVDDPAKIVENILTNSADGSIILMHEGRRSTLEALPQIISGLRAKGFEIVSVAELLSAEVHAQKENI